MTTLWLSLCTISAVAQPKWYKKARKSLIEVVSYDTAGMVLSRRAGFVITPEGNILTTYQHLVGAASVDIITSDNKTYHPLRVVTADAMMDYCVLTTDIKKPQPLPIATADAQSGQPVCVMTMNGCANDTIVRIETVGEHPYYTTQGNIAVNASPTSDATYPVLGAPLLTEDGELLGLLHATDPKGAYSVSVPTVTSAAQTPLALVGRAYTSLPIPALLPQEEEQARTFVFLSQGADSARYTTHIDDYIKLFPHSTFGYTSKGEYLMAHNDTVAAAQTYQEGIKQVSAEAHELLYSHSQALYRLAITKADNETLLRSLHLVEQAISHNPLPLYSHHHATVLYSLHRYAEAAQEFRSLATTHMRSPQTFVYASQSHRMAGDSISVILEMLDSAVACYPTPLPAESAGTILLRATTRAEAGLWRQAVTDYNQYEHLLAGRVTAEFYYRRFIAEANGRLFQPAFDDLDRAITLTPDDGELHAQKALLLYRLGQTEEARQSADKAIQADPAWAEELKDILQQ